MEAVMWGIIAIAIGGIIALAVPVIIFCLKMWFDDIDKHKKK